jgi:hypothetical protein
MPNKKMLRIIELDIVGTIGSVFHTYLVEINTANGESGCWFSYNFRIEKITHSDEKSS